MKAGYWGRVAHNLVVKRVVISGCESRGDADKPYMTRYAFPRLGSLRAMLHIFHRSDAEEHHDHPWPFVSIILWRGYLEETVCPVCNGTMRVGGSGPLSGVPYSGPCIVCQKGKLRKRVWPGMILYRPATWRHRVVLKDGKPAVTLVVIGKRVRDWGFFTRRGWRHQSDYKRENGC